MGHPNRQKGQAVVAAVVLFFFSLFLTAYTSRHPQVAQVGTALAAGILAPLQSGADSAKRGLYNLVGNYQDLVRAAQENKQLSSRLVVLQEENDRLRRLREENRQLRELLKMKESAELPGLVANVIAYSPSNWAQVITIDKGRSDGVLPEMAVVNDDGVVGQVIAALVGSAEVLLLTDHRSGIDALLDRNRARGVVGGAGNALARFDFVLSEEEVVLGDRVISSGLDGVFPKGLFIGVISALGDRSRRGLFQEIQI